MQALQLIVLCALFFGCCYGTCRLLDVLETKLNDLLIRFYIKQEVNKSLEKNEERGNNMKKQSECVLTKEQASDLRVQAFLIAGLEYKSGCLLHNNSVLTKEYEKLENDRLKAYDKFNELLDSLTVTGIE